MSKETAELGPVEELAAAAEEAVAKLEQIEVYGWVKDDGRRGVPAPWEAPAGAAQAAVEALRTAAMEALFPDFVAPVGADLRADFELYVTPILANGEAVALLYGRALQEHPKLAALIRSAHTMRLVRDARMSSPSGARDPQRQNVDAFMRGVAEHLADDTEVEDALAAIFDAVGDLGTRITSAVRRCQEDAVSRARSELSDYFRGKKQVLIGGQLVSGSEVAAKIESGNVTMFELARDYFKHAIDGGKQPARTDGAVTYV